MTKIFKDTKHLPDSPGVYLMKNKDEQVIYVGKAASLRDRVGQYARGQGSLKTRTLVGNTETLEYIVTGNEVEALVLESNLIKEHRPRYNVRLRDDKQYPYIKITSEVYPRICIARRREHDGAQYFGPYPSSKAVRELIKMASAFGIRRCKRKIPCPPCLNRHIKQCAAPCLGEVTKEEYLDIIRNVAHFLKGKRSTLIQSLTARMHELSERQEFEKAAHLRDQILALQELSEQQHVSVRGQRDQDFIAAAASATMANVQIFHVAEGKLKGRDTFSVSAAGADEEEVLSSFIKQYYQDITPPEEIVIPFELGDEAIASWLSEKGSRLKAPVRRTEKGLMNLARENARTLLNQSLIHAEKSGGQALMALQEALGLSSLPGIIEAFDISNITGTHAVGSLVAFEHGLPDKKHYRRFRIKTLEGADDVGMIREVVARAYSRRASEGKRMPDLVLIDGGKGQLNAALAALEEMGFDLAVISLAKEFEHIFLPDRDAPLILPRGSPALQLLQRIRDEAHRFALAYHKKLRGRKLRESALDEIPGVGEQKKRALLQHFGSVEKVRKASVSEIEKVPGVSKKNAEMVYGFFHEG